jgi:hypothetical protein
MFGRAAVEAMQAPDGGEPNRDGPHGQLRGTYFGTTGQSDLNFRKAHPTCFEKL